MVGSSHIVLRKVTKEKLEINCINHHVIVGMNELLTENSDQHLVYNAQLYL